MFIVILLIIFALALAITLIGVALTKDDTRDGWLLGSTISGVITVILFVIFLFAGFYTIGAGEVGVRFDPLGGGISEKQATEGLHFRAPWASIDTFNVKTQVFTMSGTGEEKASLTHSGSIRTTTNEGLYVTLDMSIQYHINPAKAWFIRQNLGKDGVYQDIVVLPQIRSTIRDVVSKYSAAEVYGEGKAIIEKEVFTDLESKLGGHNIIIESVLLRDVQLPATVAAAIESKKKAEQETLAMEYILQKASLDKEKKIIEAEAISESNKIISGSITAAYLEWYWIDAMDKNPKVIYVPTESGMPIFNSPISSE
jgi:regulator of protease activity HflC (stomatin/prohibitin superfamily)